MPLQILSVGGVTSTTEAHIWTAQQTFSVGINLTAGQLIFPATQSASADANTLDDYEEGTFTPTILDNTLSNAEGQTYTTQAGRYTKIGNRVLIGLELNISGLGCLTTCEGANVGGLPFTSNAANVNSVSVGFESGMSITANQTPAGHIFTSVAYISLNLWDTTGGHGALQLTEFGTSGRIFVSAIYEV